MVSRFWTLQRLRQSIHRRKLFSAKFSSHLSEALLFRIAGD
jgi:hypothetical protein